MLYDNIAPLTVLVVATFGNDANPGTAAFPLLTIQEGVDQSSPGTQIRVLSGGYTENVFIAPSKSGTTSAPCWLISADGEAVDGGSYATVTAASSSATTIAISGASNWVVRGFKTIGGERGVFVATNGSNHSNHCLITGCVAENATDDGFKVSGNSSDPTPAEDISVIRCIARNCGSEGIDYTNINGGEISYNEVYNCNSTAAGIFAKTGSDAIWIHHNYVHDIPNGDGIALGGQGNSDADFSYQLRNSIVEWNRVEDVDQTPFIAMGAVDCIIRNNYSDSGSYSPNIVIRYGHHNGIHLESSNVEVTGNLLLGSTTVQTIAPSTSNVHDNFTSAGDYAAEPVGPSNFTSYGIPPANPPMGSGGSFPSVPTLPETTQALLSGRTVRVAHLVEFCFAGQARRIWNGHYKLTTGGHDWFGLNKLIAIDGLEHDGEGQSAELRVTVSGADARFLEMAISDNRAGYIGEILKVYHQFFNDDWSLLDEPVARAAGIIDGIEISREPMGPGGTRRTITISAQNIFYGRSSPSASNFTNVDQQLRFPGDRGLSRLSSLQDTNIPFPW